MSAAEPTSLTPQQRRRTLVGAGLGWTFDGYETYALILTLGTALPALLPADERARVPFFAGATIALTLFGFAVGGILGGLLADRYGRRPTLLVTVCAYAVFTGLTALAWDWWSFALLRLLTGVALGSEWGTGAALVAETWPDRLRARAMSISRAASVWGSSRPPRSGSSWVRWARTRGA